MNDWIRDRRARERPHPYTQAGKAKPALRLLQRMELCGMPVGPVQLRQVFFACCGRGMVSEALALMQRKDPATGTVRLLGKDVLVWPSIRTSAYPLELNA